jgi:hypothetical protein
MQARSGRNLLPQAETCQNLQSTAVQLVQLGQLRSFQIWREPRVQPTLEN